MKKTILSSIVIVIAILTFIASSSTDINDKDAVIKDMQGSWIGNSHDGMGEFQFVHYKVEINGDRFKGWIDVGRTNDEPQWNARPDVAGDWTLSEVLTYTNSTSRYRNIYFNEDDSDNLLSARTLQNMIVYDGGLYVVGWAPMSRR